MWFYQEPVNQYISFSAWCIHPQQLRAVLEKLLPLSDVEIEFVIPQSKQGLCIPKPFEEMGLQPSEFRKSC